MLTTEQLNENSAAKKNGFIDKIAQHARKKMHDQFIRLVNPQPNDSILDVGASANPAFTTSNYLEFTYPMLNITAVGLGISNKIWKKLYPKVPYIHGSALELPFKDKSFDIVYSHAVIEHVGNFLNQSNMIREAMRVARKSIWITTPNRWHPIEFHTILPFIHWLPKSIHRFVLHKIGKGYFSSEGILNLLDITWLREAVRIAASVRTDGCDLPHYSIDSKIHTSKFLGFTGNLLLHIKML